MEVQNKINLNWDKTLNGGKISDDKLIASGSGNAERSADIFSSRFAEP